MIKTLRIGLIVLAVASMGAATAKDNSIGTWKANVEKTKYTPAPWPVKSLTAVREAVPGGVKVTNNGERTDGSKIDSTYTAMYDGSPATVSGSGSPYDTISIKRINANTFSYSAKKKDGKYSVTGKIVVSADGKTATTIAKGIDDSGKPVSLSIVYDKQ
jgi:hypothetical protein